MAITDEAVASGQGKRPCVLIVDDSEANLVALRGLLGVMECNVTSVRSGNEALAALLEQSYAAMLLDVHMPDMDGYEVASYARANPKTRDVPIIFLTALSPTVDSELKGYGSGAVDFLFRPLNPAVLRSKVGVFLDLYVARQQLLEAHTQQLQLESARRLHETRTLLLNELQRKNFELARTNLELEQLAFAVSHDLREPMRTVAIHAELLERDYADVLHGDALQRLQFVANGARRMQKVTDALRQYTDLNRQPPAYAPVDLGDVVEETLSRLHDSIRESRAHISCGKLPTVHGSRDQLCQVVENLLENALKFRQQTPEIDITAHSSNDDWIVSVQDNGIGVVESFAERAFQLFQRYHPRGQFPGAGIGLTIARNVIHQHGGRIWLEASPGRGTTVSFALPKEARAEPQS